MTPEPTPSQTIGPFFHDALLDENRSELVPADHPRAVRIEGKIFDGAGNPVPDAMVELWQADESGRYANPADDPATFSGFGRAGTDADGRFSFVTVKPGPVPDGTQQASHVTVSIFARGLLKRLITRIYFPDEGESNARDPLLSSIEDPRSRETLLARDEGGALRFDVRLQGDDQTVFFEL
jgi:protocatechuate 3,4-dioxygenase alpha subunit